jgi:hypothetical protein
MKEIGLILGVDHSRVSQIHVSAVLHLRALLAMPTTLKELENKLAGHHSQRARGRESRQRIVARSYVLCLDACGQLPGMRMGSRGKRFIQRYSLPPPVQVESPPHLR